MAKCREDTKISIKKHCFYLLEGYSVCLREQEWFLCIIASFKVAKQSYAYTISDLMKVKVFTKKLVLTNIGRMFWIYLYL